MRLLGEHTQENTSEYLLTVTKLLLQKMRSEEHLARENATLKRDLARSHGGTRQASGSHRVVKTQVISDDEEDKISGSFQTVRAKQLSSKKWSR